MNIYAKAYSKATYSLCFLINFSLINIKLVYFFYIEKFN